MKKSILVIALSVIAAVGFNASAQQQDCKKACDKKEKKECVQCKKECKKGANVFANLNLTDDQKAKLKALRENCKKQRCDSMKSKFEARKKQKCEGRAKYLGELKSILTAEQYVQFLENSYINSDQGFKMGHKKGMMHKGKGKGMRHHKGECAKGAKDCKKEANK